jgi:signal peptidase II
MFQGFSLALGFFSLFAIGALIAGFRFFTEYTRLRSLSWGLICGGVVGNAIDRMTRGSVVDYLYFYYHSLGWPAFNVADSAITVGVTLFLIAAVIHDHPPCSTPSPQP